MSRLVKIVSRSIIIMCIVMGLLHSGSYSRVLDPLMSIIVNGQIMPLTGGLNRPEPQFLCTLSAEVHK